MVRFGPDPCIACGYELQQPSQMFCVVCGEYPARKTGGGKKGVGDEKGGAGLSREKGGEAGANEGTDGKKGAEEGGRKGEESVEGTGEYGRAKCDERKCGETMLRE